MIVPYGTPVDYSKKFSIIFNHIPKCGGSTFKNILNRYFKYKFFHDLFGIILSLKEYEDFLTLYKNKKYLFINNNIISGHMTWGMHDLLFNDLDERNIYYLTILRDPWDLFVSRYKFCLTKNYFSYKITKFFKIQKNNFLCNWLGGGDLDRAKETLGKKHYLFGLVERFDDFLKMFGFFLGFKEIEYEVFNKSDIKLPEEDLMKLKSRFLEENKSDYELYNFAKELFEKRFEKIEKYLLAIKVKKHVNNEVFTKRNKTAYIIFHSNLSFSKKENLAFESVLYDRNAPIWLLLEYYKRNKIWDKLFLLSKVLLDILKIYKIQYNKIYNFNLERTIKMLKENLKLTEEKILTNAKENLNPLESKFKNFVEKIIKIKEENIAKDILDIIYINKLNKENFITFCKTNSYKRISFYGISGRFFEYYSLIEKFLLNTEKEIFLFDTDEKKHGLKIGKLTIRPPEEIPKINPDIIIITSFFWKDILEHIKKEIFNKKDVPIKIGFLENNFIFYINFNIKEVVENSEFPVPLKKILYQFLN